MQMVYARHASTRHASTASWGDPCGGLFEPEPSAVVGLVRYEYSETWYEIPVSSLNGGKESRIRNLDNSCAARTSSEASEGSAESWIYREMASIFIVEAYRLSTTRTEFVPLQ